MSAESLHTALHAALWCATAGLGLIACAKLRRFMNDRPRLHAAALEDHFAADRIRERVVGSIEDALVDDDQITLGRALYRHSNIDDLVQKQANEKRKQVNLRIARSQGQDSKASSSSTHAEPYSSKL